MKRAVESGYWPLYRFNPELEKEGKNPFVLESKAPDGTLQEFLGGETRFASLEKTFPEESKKLRQQIEQEANRKYEMLRLIADTKSICDDAEGSKEQKDEGKNQ
jgi:pyruvate-ferredoxin/flavodoxin oxidoreductase